MKRTDTKVLVYLFTIFLVSLIISSDGSVSLAAGEKDSCEGKLAAGGDMPPMPPDMMMGGGPMPGPDGQTPPPHPPMMGGPDENGGPRGKHMGDFMKNLTNEQREEGKRLMMLGKAYNDMADVSLKSGKIDDAVSYLRKSIELEMPSFLPKEMTEERRNMLRAKIIQIYLKSGKDAEAAKETETLAASDKINSVQKAFLFNTIGNSLRDKYPDKAADFIKRSIELLEKKEIKK